MLPFLFYNLMLSFLLHNRPNCLVFVDAGNSFYILILIIHAHCFFFISLYQRYYTSEYNYQSSSEERNIYEDRHGYAPLVLNSARQLWRY